MNDSEREVLKGLRHSISINIMKTEVNDIEDGQMNVFNEGFEERYHDEIKFVALIYPFLNDGIYEFYLDDEGITREKVMFNTDSNNEIINLGNKNKENPNKKRKLF
uniref:Galectin n=1 Tax=Meloidogyne floridensis TaxID=298350 RepID=A0A915NGT4_9BILA